MTSPQRPTFLGGKLSNLSLEDLNPHELVAASVGALGQAEALLPIANAQISAATEQQDMSSARSYTMSRHTLLGILGLTATAQELAQQLRSSNVVHEGTVFPVTVRLIHKYFVAYGENMAPDSFQALHTVASRFNAMRTESGPVHVHDGVTWVKHYKLYSALSQPSKPIAFYR